MIAKIKPVVYIFILILSGCSYLPSIPTQLEWAVSNAPYKSNSDLCEVESHGGVLAEVATSELRRRGVCCEENVSSRSSYAPNKLIPKY
jgi:hypothetical protein